MKQSRQIVIDNQVYIVDEDTEDIVIEDNLTLKEKIIEKIRERYSIDDEIAIIRQKDSKVDEFNEYNCYVENIKRELKNQQ